VFVSNTVHDQVRDRLPFLFEIWASSRSKTSPAPSGSTGFARPSPTPSRLRRGPPSPAMRERVPSTRGVRRVARRHCRSPTSHRSRCCLSPI
jgi:hypothetical protein